MIDKTDVREVRDVVDQARTILNTTSLPDGRLIHARDLMEQAVDMIEDLIARPPLSAARPKLKVRRQL